MYLSNWDWWWLLLLLVYSASTSRWHGPFPGSARKAVVVHEFSIKVLFFSPLTDVDIDDAVLLLVFLEIMLCMCLGIKMYSFILTY